MAAPSVIFVCVGNSCRSQMAEGLARSLGFEVASAGTEPAERVAPKAVEVMAEVGLDISAHVPSVVDPFSGELDAYDRVISMGCGVEESCPALKADEDWGLDDPVGHGIEVYRSTRDEIRRRVLALAVEMGVVAQRTGGPEATS